MKASLGWAVLAAFATPEPAAAQESLEAQRFAVDRDTAASKAPPTAVEPRPNVIVVLVDDIGRDKFGFYGVGFDPPKTPNMDKLVSKGVLFRNAWSYHACSPTRAAILTGRYADRTGIGSVIKPGDGLETPLELEEHLLPEDLPGYRTTHLGKWHLGDRATTSHHPLVSGFDSSISWEGQNDYLTWTEWDNGVATPRTGYYPASMAEHAVKTIRAAEGPYFIYYAMRLGHAPFHVPPAELHSVVHDEPTVVMMHKAMTEAFDTLLGRVLAEVDLTTTYVFVLGDNGSPGPTVHGKFEAKKSKGTFYEGGIGVPLVVAGPGVVEGGETNALVHVTDIFATVRELTGLGPPTKGAEDSVSFASTLKDPSAVGSRESLYVHRFPTVRGKGRQQRAVRTQRWKLIEDTTLGTEELYDLEKDPHEVHDLFARAAAELAAEGEPGPTGAALLRLRALFPTFSEPKESTKAGR